GMIAVRCLDPAFGYADDGADREQRRLIAGVRRLTTQREILMLQRVPDAFRPYALVYTFVSDHVRMQFEDVGAMLRLPMQAHGLTNGCNFASTSVICNLLGGVSVTVFQPAVTQRPDRHGRMQTIGSGE